MLNFGERAVLVGRVGREIPKRGPPKKIFMSLCSVLLSATRKTARPKHDRAGR